MSALLYKHHKTSTSILSLQLADLLTLFILFHALMLVAHRECELPPLNDTGKEQKLATDFEKILTITLASWIELVLYFGVTAQL